MCLLDNLVLSNCFFFAMLVNCPVVMVVFVVLVVLAVLALLAVLAVLNVCKYAYIDGT